MELSDYLPIWNKLTPAQQETLSRAAAPRTMERGKVIQRSSGECLGLLLVRSGQLRAYLLSEEGREITLYRLFDRDICLFSASCVLHSIQFDVTVEAEKETEVLLVSPDAVKAVMEQSAALANYINELMASRFSEVMWLVEQVLWKSLDKRLAGFLLDETDLEGEDRLTITHETIGKHLGTAREVVTRMLRYFQREGMVELTRGQIVLTDREKLEDIRDS